MSWLQKIFGVDYFGQTETPPTTTENTSTPETETIPPERVGLYGEYDQSGLAKRVALAFDQDPSITEIDTLWVAQTGSIVVLKGKVPTASDLTNMVKVASKVAGATGVDVQQVEVIEKA